MTYLPSRFKTVLSVTVLCTVAACSGNPIGPSNQFVNNVDTFRFQRTDIVDATQTLSYSWTITGSAATVDIAGVVTGGTATVTITDAQGVEVFSGDLDGNNNTSTNSGAAGTWTIRIDLVGVSGTLDLRVQKKP